ncbi:MAG: MlaD family protein [Bacteroidales bacterium]|nr:MlaD family protein [Bacteroidales bacterium]
MVINRNIKIGAFAIAAFLVLLLGVNYLKGQDVFFRGCRFYSYYDNVNGLTDASPINYKGFKVGTVRSVEICPDEPEERRFKVTLALDKWLDVPKDSKAIICSTDLLGGMGIDLVWGESKVIAESGDTLESGLRLGLLDQIEPLKDKAEIMVEQVDTMLVSVNDLLGGENGKRLAEAISALDATLKNLETISRNVEKMTSARGVLTESLAGLDSLMSALGKQGGNINLTMDGLSKFSQQLAESRVDSLVGTLNKTMASLGQMVESVDSARGTVGKMLNDSKLYDKLAESSENLNRLLVDVRLNPSRYVKISAINFGKNTYFSDAGNGMAMVGLVYTVSLATSSNPLDFPTEIDGQRVMEWHKDKKTYEYLMGQFRERSDAEAALKKLKSTYSEAKLRAFDSGKEVSL